MAKRKRRSLGNAKFSRNYVKGLRSGAQIAKKDISRHGCTHARRVSRALSTQTSSHFELGQTMGFNQVVHKSCKGR